MYFVSECTFTIHTPRSEQVQQKPKNEIKMGLDTGDHCSMRGMDVAVLFAIHSCFASSVQKMPIPSVSVNYRAN